MLKKPQAKLGALGRGMASLIPQGGDDDKALPKAPELRGEGLRQVPIEDINPMPGQPRTQFDQLELNELAASIKEKGILQPILVRPLAKGYQLIAGERRWQAAQRAGLATVPVLVKNVEEAEAFQLALIENLQREDLNPIEIGRAYKRLVEDYRLSHEEIATRMGKDRASVTNYLRVLTLPPTIVARVEDRTLSFGHARALAGLSGPELAALDDAKLLSGRLSVREIEALVAKIRARAEAPKKSEAEASRRGETAQIRYLRRKIEERLGLKVTLKDRDGKGRLVLEYTNLDELDGLLKLLGIGE